MKTFEGLLNKIKGLGKSDLKKSDMPDGGSNPPPADGGANIDDATTKVVAAFTDGSLEPTAEAVTAYLVANGTPEDQASDMADMILDSYFEASPEDGAPEGGEVPAGEPDGDEAMKSEFAKLVHSVQKSTFGTEVLSQGMTKLFEKFEALESKVEAITKDNQIMKSALRVAAGKPAGATPILKAELAATKSDIPIARKREMILEVIQKSTLEKVPSPLDAAELSYLNKYMEFSDSAKAYFTKQGVKI